MLRDFVGTCASMGVYLMGTPRLMRFSPACEPSYLILRVNHRLLLSP
jgi:hypothetical protein